jgi:hypothetical protein
MYDFACGAVASIEARMRNMKDDGHSVPQTVWAWSAAVKWLVDKFHMKTHTGKFNIRSFPAPTLNNTS